jgi:hypothetical protein
MENRCKAITGINRVGNGFNGVSAPYFQCKAAAVTGTNACAKHTVNAPKRGFIEAATQAVR